MSFLTGEWRKLVMANYSVDPTVLLPYLPYGTELDFFEDKCFVSVIGFMFLNTKLLGIKVPFHSNFEEVNLRFYVKRKQGNEWKRGVVFVKEIVPKYALAFVANTVYNENYEATPMSHNWEFKDEQQRIAYKWKKNDIWNSIGIKASIEAKEIIEGSKAEFITEHYWGYAKINSKSSNEYEVTHPKWKVYDVIDHTLEIDFEANYGSAFGFLKNLEPDSIILAEGSEITVEPKKKITLGFRNEK